MDIQEMAVDEQTRSIAAQSHNDCGLAHESPMLPLTSHTMQAHIEQLDGHNRHSEQRRQERELSSVGNNANPSQQSTISPTTTSISEDETELKGRAAYSAPLPSSAFATPSTPLSGSSEDNLARSTYPYRSTREIRSHVRSYTLAHAVTSSLPPTRTVSPSESSTPADFLTLVAGQERRVLELKEELHRAEQDLVSLKKQWAVLEANKKKGELRNGGVVKMETLQSPSAVTYIDDQTPRGPTLRGHGRSATLATVVSGSGLNLQLDEESNASESSEAMDGEKRREKRRSLMQDRMRRRGTTLEHGMNSSSGLGRRSSQRVFSGSRHTRALSLLATAPKQNGTIAAAASELDNVTDGDLKRKPFAAGVHEQGLDVNQSQDDRTSGFPSLTRTTSGFGRELNLGKTYKELASAASRRTIPQGADALMKHGKVVVDGVRDGLWNFFEDIRQATVGEEAARENRAIGGSGLDSQKKNSAHSSKSARKASLGQGKKSKENLKPSEQSFWREHGVDTPRANRKKNSVDVDSQVDDKSGGRSIRTRGGSLARGVVKGGPGQSTEQSHDKHDFASSNYESTETNLEEDKMVERISSESANPPSEQSRLSHNQMQACTPKKDHHLSHSSTDSGDSRDSRQTSRSLLMFDSPTTTINTNDTEPDPDREVDDDADEKNGKAQLEADDDEWEWKESDSPSQIRKDRMTLDICVDVDGDVGDHGTNINVDMKNNSQHKVQKNEYDWHSLAR